MGREGREAVGREDYEGRRQVVKEVIYQRIIERDGRKYLETGYEEKTPTGVIRTARFETYKDPNAQTKLF